MEKESSVIINRDTARRMRLNSERNPRETIYGEATNQLNPLTGRPYEKDFMPECERKRIKNNYGLKEWNAEMYVNSLLSLISQTSPEIEVQRALGRMEVRDGRLPEFLYEQFLEGVDKLTEIYSQNPDLTLESIRDITGLNLALSRIERRRFLPPKNLIINPPYKIYPDKYAITKENQPPFKELIKHLSFLEDSSSFPRKN